MKERPILFSAPMVRALLDGSKTQTRRAVKGSQAWPANTHHVTMLETRGTAMAVDHRRCSYAPEIKCPYGMSGDRLWVREAWSHDAPSLEQCRASHEDIMVGGFHGPYYRATETAPETLRWKPSIHMPRWASRINLEITAGRVERLQDISRADAIAEGAPPSHPSINRISQEYGFADFSRSWYGQLWEQINGAGSWAANPWVWVIEFKRIK